MIMHKGIFWYERDPKMIRQMIANAIEHYRKKYGRKPELCLTNPSMSLPDGDQAGIEGIVIKTFSGVPPGHIWIGVEEMPTGASNQ